MFRNIFRAIRLDPSFYLQVSNDRAATIQAVGILVLVAISLALSGIAEWASDKSNAAVFAYSFLNIFSYWVILSVLGFLPGRYLVKRELTFGSMLRVIAFANTPRLFYMLLVLGPLAALLVNTVIMLWVIACLLMAFHQTLRVSFLATFPMTVAGVFIAENVRILLYNHFLG